MYKNYTKRILDFSLSLTGFIILSPIFLIITLLLCFANNGKPFFFQPRPGKNEKIFKVIKFKTMNDKKDRNGNLLPDAERLTRIGGFIRKTSLDEIPQLINVIKGNMSLIGPRPLLVEYLPYYTTSEKKRHQVKPGITGLAQINGRNNIEFSERFEYDVKYVENISFALDMQILFKTIVNVLKQKAITTITNKEFHW
jgi:lipopolysaccharide/colanic/teichoic acid biosynthesis glycosyltransferase